MANATVWLLIRLTNQKYYKTFDDVFSRFDDDRHEFNHKRNLKG